MASVWVKDYDYQQTDETCEETVEDIWDDTALIQAYDRAVNSFKNGKEKKPDKAKPKEDIRKKEKKRKNKTKSPLPDKEFHWNIGDKCQALYAEDGLLYMATIIDVDEKEKTCAVEFDYYENIETVDYEDIFEKDFGLKENRNIEKSVPKQRNKIQREKSPVIPWSIGDICVTYNSQTQKKEEAVITALSSGFCDLTFVRTKTKETVKTSSLYHPKSQRQADLCDCGSYGQDRCGEGFAQNMYPNYCPPFFPPPSDMFMPMPPTFSHPFSQSPYRDSSSRRYKRSFPSSFDPLVPPPPPPLPFPSQLEDGNESALASMLMSWYMVGYHTGYYQGLKKDETKQDTSRCSTDDMDQYENTSDEQFSRD